MSNLATSVSKQSTEFGGSLVNQLKAHPFSEVGKTRHRTASSVVYMLMVNRVVPSYQSLLNPFHLSDNGASMIKSVKGWRGSASDILSLAMLRVDTIYYCYFTMFSRPHGGRQLFSNELGT